MESTDFLVPGDIQTACRHLDRLGAQAHLLAGGTDLMVAVNLRRLFPERFICLGDCGLATVSVSNGKLAIGAAVTISSIIKSDLVMQNAPLLVDACRTMASPGIRNAATIGGNVCNASPAADGAVALLALGAEVNIVSSSGEHSVAIEDFFTGPGQTILGPNEIVTGFNIPLRQAGVKWGWSKLGQRKAEAISIASAAICLSLENGKCRGVRIALGAVAPTPLLAVKAAEMLEGEAPEAGLVAKVAEKASDGTSPIDDIRASAWYRRQIVRETVSRILGDIS
jgi:CO/xanthine dehydrogenase FAD-binding subunit